MEKIAGERGRGGEEEKLSQRRVLSWTHMSRACYIFLGGIVCDILHFLMNA